MRSTLHLSILENNRWHGIDIAKGLLIILVVFGHTIPTPIPKDLIKYIIYGFHMPAFLFISGFLTRQDKLKSRSFIKHISYYGIRLILPWFLISLVWQVYRFHNQIPLTIKSFAIQLISIVFSPDYHLWFIPSLFFMLAVVWVFSISERWLIILLAISSVLAVVIPVVYPGNLKLGIYPLIGDKRNLSYLIYFVLGYLIRNQGKYQIIFSRSNVFLGLRLIFLISFVAYIYCFWYNSNIWVEYLCFFVMNVCFLVHTPKLFLNLNNKNLVGKILSILGANTLWIYLLHPFITYPLQSLNAMFPDTLEYPVAITETLMIVGVAFFFLQGYQQLKTN